VSFVSVLKAGMSLSDEERKMCARFEDYTKKIRSKELRFTKEADSVTIVDPIAKEKVSLPTYFGKSMADYDRQKIDEAGHRTMVEADYSQPTEENQWSSLTRMAHFSLLGNAEKLRFVIARNALAMIDEALASPTPLIVEGEAYLIKLGKCENELDGLKGVKANLETDLIACREENKKLRNNLEGMQKLVGTFESTVERDPRESKQ